ncbi:MAG: DEAD/DEAH box helicase family protein, partial [Candidatus Nanoarchaeia archaeon]|nr:DEAD/DEAH box helicase family protein [Candidatus Haiyanarchaeum thermophilum]
MFELKNFKLREYQEEILNTARNHNTLVVLPTGLGKTAIALALTIERLNQCGGKVLFLAPTRPLVNQHYNFFLEYSNIGKEQIGIVTGKIRGKKREEIFNNSLVIFATPQTIQNELMSGRLSLTEFSLLIVDECHRCVKNYAYTYVARKYLQEAGSPLLLGLTASPGHSEEDILEICQNLGIKKIEMRTEWDEDLRPYVQRKDIEIVTLNLPAELNHLLEYLKSDLRERIEELRANGVIELPPSKVTKNYLLQKCEEMAKEVEKNKVLFNFFLKLIQLVKVYHAWELTQTQGLRSLMSYLEKLKNERRRSSKLLFSDPKFVRVYFLVKELLAKGVELPKYFKLVEIISKELERNPTAKFIVFSSYRKTVNAIYDYLLRYPSIHPARFVGQSGEDGMKQEEQIRVIGEFGKGEKNVLVCTTIGEEGLHIPEVDVAVMFEPVPSALRMIQR